MDLKGKDLVAWFRKRRREDFPGGRSYVVQYNDLSDFLAADVHPHVATGAALTDGIYLNDHGPEHVATVIRRASELVSSKECDLKPYEVYLLLSAIQIHDVGNILGRSHHEAEPKRMLGNLDSKLGTESVEKRIVYGIAEAHGGTVEGDKDTIARRLSILEPVLGIQVRPRFLAALLRFADELADDRTRTSRFALEHGVLPEASKLFHKYSESLQSVVVDIKGRNIELHFELSEPDALITFQKGSERVYLLDELLARTLKMHRERVYCMRFLRPHQVNVDTISVTIKVFGSGSPYDPPLVTIGYRLEDQGYPDDSRASIAEVCPELVNWHNGAPLGGETLLSYLQERRGKQ